MKWKKGLLCLFILVICTISITTYALTEDEVSLQVEEKGKEAISGNLFVWALCAVAFLKISQKLDSFMSALGISVGQTGGSMLGEAMLLTKMFTSGRHGGGIFRGMGPKNGFSASGRPPGFAGGGFNGFVGKHFGMDAVNAVTGRGGGSIGSKMFDSSLQKGGKFATGVIGAVARGNISQVGSITGTAASDALMTYMGYRGATAVASMGRAAEGRAVDSGIKSVMPGQSSKTVNASISGAASPAHTLSGKLPSQPPERTIPSLAPTEEIDFNGGSTEPFNNPIGGENGIPYTTESSVESAAGFEESIPTFTNVEIGGGRITGTETSVDHPNGREFAMYDAAQYMAPDGKFDEVKAIDNSKWYKQYAVNAVERAPYMAENGKIQYNEKLIKKLPTPPKRKERL